MKLKRFFWIQMYIIAALLPSVFYIVDSVNNKSGFLLILSGVFGITSYVLFAFQFLLASRIKMIDKQFGLDRIYRFHMVIAVLAIIFAFLHKNLKGIYYSDSFQTSLGDNALAIFIAISVFSILMMVNKLFFKINSIDYIRRFLNKTIKIKYQYKVMIHNLTLIGLIVLLAHILLAYSVKSNPFLEITLIIYFTIPLATYFNHKIIKRYFDKNKKYKISEILHDANNIITLKLKPIYGSIFNYLPGQFLYLRIYNPDIPCDEHPFTISSSPAELDYISVTVKQLGDFTSSLSKIKFGDSAYVDGPFGSFSYLTNPSGRKICFIAGGIGITPFLSMLRYMSFANEHRDVVLFWGIRNLSELIYKNEFLDFKSKRNNFNFVPVLSDDASFDGEKGFIDNYLINKYLANVLEYDFYICGPPVMLEVQLKNLKDLGVPKKNIHFERFAI